MKMSDSKTYLVCPLNWGLGHASRIVPIINQLLLDKHKVILCGDGYALDYLINEFPQCENETLKDLSIKFSPKGTILNLLKIIPQITYQITYEHFALKGLLKKHNIDVIISDNRYGLWNKSIHSIFITHQLMVKLPKPFKAFEYLIHKLIKSIIKKYNECWIPDYKNEKISLSGELAHKYKLPSNAKFIGPLSRFSSIETTTPLDTNYDIVTIISGPEPSRSYFETIISNILQNSDYKTLIIRGIPDNNECLQHKNITKVSSLPSIEIKYHLSNAKLIICRSGYSTLMDLDSIKRKGLLIPTPGQTEQEYLAEYHKKDEFHIIAQEKICLNYINNLMRNINQS